MTAFGIFSRAAERPRVGYRVGDAVLDLAGAGLGAMFDAPTLNPFLARGRAAWGAAMEAIATVVGDESHLVPLRDVSLHLPFTVADYVDFYASREHATNLGRILRPETEPLLPNWLHLPVGYHGRAGTVVPSGTDVVRPCGQTRPAGAERPGFGPTARLDFELELGFVVGVPSEHGTPVPASAFADHVFGVVLVNDWSARDIQAWEYQPLGPFLGKSFATTISAWVTPLAVLDRCRVAGPAQDPAPLDYLQVHEPRNLDVALTVELNGEVVSRTNARSLYWSPAQQLAHMTVNGASLRTGDLFATGTISGAEQGSQGSLIELTRNGEQPLRLVDGSTRSFLEDGDEVVLRGQAGDVELGEVRGRVVPARCA